MEQSATPWRVFDAPSTATGPDGSGAQPAPPPAAAPPLGGSNRLAIAGVAGAVAIGAIAIVVALSGAGGAVVEAPSGSHAITGGAAQLAGAGELVVDVTGAVSKPGVYHLPAGSRIGDAIDAAGGFSSRVDADGVATTLNLAEPLNDGSQVHVPSRDDAGSGPTGGAGSGAGGGGGGGAGDAQLINLNTATASELDTLPGIGPVTAAKIIDSRTTAPFESVDDLRTRKLVGEKTFAQLQPLVTVR